MLPEKSLAGPKRNRSAARSQRLRSAVGSSGKLFRLTCAVILTCVAVGTELQAQMSLPVDPCTDPGLNPPFPCVQKDHSNTPDDTKAALVCEWVDLAHDGVLHTRKALERLTSSAQDPAVADLQAAQDPNVLWKVFNELIKSLPEPFDKGVYQSALGNPSPNGKLRGRGIPDFLGTLAKANRLTLQEKGKSQYEQDVFQDKLFECTKKFIGDIYERSDPSREPGPLAITRIQGAFVKDNNFGLLQLLNAEWDPKATDSNELNSKNLEKFRAAFAMNTERLKSQIAEKNVTAPQQ
jgi:hypothetical protein